MKAPTLSVNTLPNIIMIYIYTDYFNVDDNNNPMYVEVIINE